MECLARYGVHAKAVLPELREMRRNLSKKDENAGQLDKLIAEIESATDSPTLVNLKDFIAHASAKGDASTNTKNGAQ